MRGRGADPVAEIVPAFTPEGPDAAPLSSECRPARRLRVILGPDPECAAEPTVGERIRAQRRALARTLHDVAREAGCSRSYLSQIENARVAPPAEALLARLELALGLAPGDLARPARAQRSLRGPRARSFGSGSLRRDLARLESALARLAGWLDGPDRAHQSHDLAVPVLAEPGTPPGAAERLRVPGLRDPTAFAIRLRTDLAAPRYRAGDLILFTRGRAAASDADCFVRLLPGPGGPGGFFARVRYSGLGPVRAEPLALPGPARIIPREKIAGLDPAITIIRSLSVGGQHPME